MKTIQELSELEILKLSNKEIEKIIKYRKAQEWIKLLEKPIQPEYEDVPNKDDKYYSIKWLSNFEFNNSITAENIIKVITPILQEDWVFYKTRRNRILFNKLSWYDKDEASIKLIQEECYSSEIKELAEQIEKRNEEKKSNYNRNLEEYEKYLEDIEWLIDEVWNKVFEIRRKYERLQKLQNDYLEYLLLSENNEKIAEWFLKNVNTVNEEELIIIKWDTITL